MSPRLHFYVALLVFTVALAPLGMSVFDEKQASSANMVENYEHAMATITEAKLVRRKRSGSRVDITYTFTAAGRSRFVGSGTLTTDEWATVEDSLRVRVRYDPSSPNKNLLAGPVEDSAEQRPLWLRIAVSMVLVTPFALGLAGAWAWFRRRQSAGIQNR